MMTDEALMVAVRNGDMDCLSTLFRRHSRPLYGFLYRMTDDRGLAEDLVQEIFVRALKYRHTYEDEGTFQAWLYRIARNAYNDVVRKKLAFESIDVDFEAPTSSPGPGEHFEREDATARLREALRRLAPEKRELIILARYQGLTHEELGNLMGADAGTMRVRLHRAIRQLETIFHELGGSTRCSAKKLAND